MIHAMLKTGRIPVDVGDHRRQVVWKIFHHRQAAKLVLQAGGDVLRAFVFIFEEGGRVRGRTGTSLR